MSTSDKDYLLKIQQREENKRIKKQRDEYRDKFNKQFEQYSKDKPIKCLSDKGLLYLRFGIDKLRNFNGKDYIAEAEEIWKMDFTEFCTEFYNEKIRGNIEFTNKSMISVASAVLYTCCVIQGVNTTQKDIAEVYHVAEVRIRNNYKFVRKVLHI